MENVSGNSRPSPDLKPKTTDIKQQTTEITFKDSTITTIKPKNKVPEKVNQQSIGSKISLKMRDIKKLTWDKLTNKINTLRSSNKTPVDTNEKLNTTSAPYTDKDTTKDNADETINIEFDDSIAIDNSQNKVDDIQQQTSIDFTDKLQTDNSKNQALDQSKEVATTEDTSKVSLFKRFLPSKKFLKSTMTAFMATLRATKGSTLVVTFLAVNLLKKTGSYVLKGLQHIKQATKPSIDTVKEKSTKEANSKEVQPEEVDSKEVQPEEVQPEEVQPEEVQPTEVGSKEIQPKEAESKEVASTKDTSKVSLFERFLPPKVLLVMATIAFSLLTLATGGLTLLAIIPMLPIIGKSIKSMASCAYNGLKKIAKAIKHAIKPETEKEKSTREAKEAKEAKEAAAEAAKEAKSTGFSFKRLLSFHVLTALTLAVAVGISIATGGLGIPAIAGLAAFGLGIIHGAAYAGLRYRKYRQSKQEANMPKIEDQSDTSSKKPLTADIAKVDKLEQQNPDKINIDSTIISNDNYKDNK